MTSHRPPTRPRLEKALALATRDELNLPHDQADGARVTGAEHQPTIAAAVVADAGAFAAMFDQHAQEVFRFCLRRCADRDQAEDVMSTVFLEAWRCRERAVEVDGSMRPWLFGIARNVARTAHRAKFRHRAALRRFHAANPKQAESDPADQIVSQVDAERASPIIHEALLCLTKPDRDVADLCLVQDRTTAAAAIALGIPEGTVKSRLSRARHQLRRMLQTGEDSNHEMPTGHEQVEQPPVAPAGRP